MATPLENAHNQLAEWQKRIDTLSRIPEVEGYGVGTVIRFTARNRTYVAVKSQDFCWQISGRTGQIPWDTLVANYLTTEVTAFDLATGWDDHFIEPPVDESPVRKATNAVRIRLLEERVQDLEAELGLRKMGQS